MEYRYPNRCPDLDDYDGNGEDDGHLLRQRDYPDLFTLYPGKSMKAKCPRCHKSVQEDDIEDRFIGQDLVIGSDGYKIPCDHYDDPDRTRYKFDPMCHRCYCEYDITANTTIRRINRSA